MSFKIGQKINNIFFAKKCIRVFNSKEQVYEYLEKDVFVTEQFQSHISETAKTLDISYLLAYEIITNYLTDILYEIDIAANSKTKKARISVHSYFFLEIGFMVSVKNKKMFLEQLIKR